MKDSSYNQNLKSLNAAKTRLRSSSPAQTHGTLIEDKYFGGLSKPKWKF